ncbi:hypothetical protein CSE16_02845 [Solibacillus sp. R5-41]|uniref:hypothetical protein n=1 Tax=Solibacillus sp. R5-41 TaxID=2048654 RepID=UPI000C1282DE|nr:hypothetical protein [Solibacillus sp. R5-41]ATP39047.1 hypothetical protein CSE16_02845 [Solibacillus sp. R5-41]
MKKNVQIRVLTGLLLVPGAVAHANEANKILNASAIPYNVVAASTVESLLASFKGVNEEASAETVAVERKKYDTLSQAEKDLLNAANDNLLALIDAKLTYLEEYQVHKKTAKSLEIAINKLTNTNTNIIAETEKAEEARVQLHKEFTASLDKVSAAAESSPLNATDFLSTLKYFKSTGTDEFIEAMVTKVSLTNLENKVSAIEPVQEFITDFITPLLAVKEAKPVDKKAFETEVTEARAAFNVLESQIKALTKIQIVENNVNVENTIKNAETDLSKAVAVENAIKDMVSNPPTTPTTFRSKMSAIQNSYAALNDFQKALVKNYDEVADFIKVIAMMDDIDSLAKMAVNSDQFREKLLEVGTAYNALGTDLKNLVSNTSKLIEMEKGVEKAKEIEKQIMAITIDNATSATPEARAAYNALSATDRKYVKKGDLDLLAAWEKSNSSANGVIKQINDISTTALAEKDVTNFITKTKTAIAGYSKMSPTDQPLVTNRARLNGLTPYMEIAAAIMTLNSTSTTYATDLTDATAKLATWDSLASTGLTAADQPNLVAMKALLQTKLDNLVSEKDLATKIDERILAVKNTISLAELANIRIDYDALSANGKKLVKNYAVLTAIESQYKSVLNVVNLIEKIDFGAKDFAKKVIAANAAYEKIPTDLKNLVDNYIKLQEFLQVAQLMLDIDGISTSAKDFREKVTTAEQTFKTLTANTSLLDKPTSAKERLLKEYGPKLETFQKIIASANTMVDKINALSSKTGQAFMDELALLTAEYKAMDSTMKRSVTNAALLTALEKDYKASLNVFTMIEKLPANTDKSFSKKVLDAEKAYQKLTKKQQENVYNYTTKLQPVLKVASLIDRIDKLKVGSKTYQAETAAIRAEYDALTPAEQALVHNYSKLTGAEDNMTSAEKVVALIKEAIPTADNYIEKLTAARNAYDALDKSQQKLVTNYKDLTNRERAVKPVLTLDASIILLDPSNARTFISKYKSAEKAYEKLTLAERGLLLNSAKLTGELKALFNVMNAINNIKSSSKTFVADTQAARAMYDALPADQQAKISNISVLKDHELNVSGGASVDALIRDLNSVSPKEFIAKVKEASQAYKALSSTNKKAVTLIDELKSQEKYIKPVEVAIDEIEGLSNPRNDLSRQFDKVNKALKKLDSKQMSYVTNIDKYSNLSNVIYVYQLIDKLKPSDKYYLGNLEAAKLAYDRLSSDEKLKVTNYYKLQESQLDVTEIQKVTNIIASLSRSSSTYVEDVEKAAAAYKELPSGSKRQVMNYDILKQAEKDIKVAKSVIKQIEEIDPSLRTFESKTKSALKAYDKLTEEQKLLIANYNLLQNYVFELGL